jgi:hypothetical protein
MLTIKIHKAQGTPKDRGVQELTVIVDREIPCTDDLIQTRKLYQTEAKLLVDALMSCLPGGTIDQVGGADGAEGGIDEDGVLRKS